MFQNLSRKWPTHVCQNAAKLSLRSLSTGQNNSFNTVLRHKYYRRGLSAIALGGCSCFLVYNNKLWTREGRRVCLVKFGGIHRFLRYV